MFSEIKSSLYLHFHDCLSGCINLLEFLRYKVKTEYRENAVLMVISLFDFGTTFMYSRSNKFWSSGRQCHSLTQRKMLHCKTLVYIIRAPASTCSKRAVHAGGNSKGRQIASWRRCTCFTF
jgi:hypothetical protein